MIGLMCHNCGTNGGFPHITVDLSTARWVDKDGYFGASMYRATFCSGKCLGEYIENAKTKVRDAFWDGLTTFMEEERKKRQQRLQRTDAKGQR